MITKKQIKKYCKQNEDSRLLAATLDYDYQVPTTLLEEGYTVPAGTIVEVRLYTKYRADLHINGVLMTKQLPYDAATLLETEE